MSSSSKRAHRLKVQIKRMVAQIFQNNKGLTGNEKRKYLMALCYILAESDWTNKGEEKKKRQNELINLCKVI